MSAEQIAAGLTCEEARRLHGDDLPRFMTSTPDTILRSYGAVNVTQADIDSANEAIAVWNTRAQETPDAQ